MTLGVVLAGGQARRMGGGDKCLLQLGGQPILTRVLERLSGQVGDIVINANGDPARFADFGYDVVSDSLEDYPGPLAGVLAGMDAAASRGAHDIVTVAADTPFFPHDLVAVLRKARGTLPVALAATPDPERGVNRHPTFGLWSVDLRDELRDALGEGLRRVVAWTDRYGAATAMFPAADGNDPFFNINTPEDLAEAEARLQASAR
ncbi:molybdenum cofactor guanylyltransferase MobA [Oceanibium sediminis]|uniref:molybdenum cofactor guanylyltransferase MobA n=1 Tax=Oceanibium sediminis TaxID=2026339 RepID=UPI000DD495C4|nr:molybdenum cofactor guanylyltransferase MobA [Oceanibium sediminis]